MHAHFGLATIFVVIALICELIAALPVPSRINLIALGLFFYFLSLLIGAF